jgi:hypothetical protein
MAQSLGYANELEAKFSSDYMGILEFAWEATPQPCRNHHKVIPAKPAANFWGI